MPSALPTGAASLDAVAAYVDQVRLTPVLRDTLVDLLREQAPVYSGRGTNEAERLRGYVLASFEATGLPPAAIPYVLEELESGRNPYTVAAAAAALRGAEGLPGDALRFLLAAIDRIRAADDVVSFETFALRQHRETSTTALQEIFRTLAWLGPLARPVLGDLKALLANSASSFSQPVCEELERAIDTISHAPPSSAPCCAQAALTPHIAEALSGVSLRDVELQDQAGTVITFAEAFFGRPSVLAFFYTRCMNPEKCSLTVSRLARVQRRLKDEGLGDRTNVAGITYDPASTIRNVCAPTVPTAAWPSTSATGCFEQPGRSSRCNGASTSAWVTDPSPSTAIASILWSSTIRGVSPPPQSAGSGTRMMCLDL